MPPAKKVVPAADAAQPAFAGLFRSPERRNAVLCLLLAVATLSVYNPVNRHPFVNYDDDRYVTENPHVRQGFTWDTFTWALTSTDQANWHPLTWMSHALDYSLFRLNPAGHHFTSVLLHAVNVVLLFLVLLWGTRRAEPSLLVAALFALHPINVESVAWVAERKNILCTTFFLLTLAAYGWYARKPHWKRYSAVFLLFTAALASKPMAITLPCALLLLDYWPLNRVRTDAASERSVSIFSWPRLFLEKLPLFVLSAASAVITMKAQEAGGAMRSTVQFPLSVRLANAVYAYAMYLWKMVWPQRLAPLYPHPGDSLAGWQLGIAALCLIAITALVFALRARRYLVVGWLWFLGTLVPVLGLVQVGDAAMADRYAYIPLLGIFVMIAFGFTELTTSLAPLWKAIPVVAVLLLLAFATVRQIGYWSSSYQLWTHALAVTQNNFIAEDNLGGALVARGEADAAYPHFQAAARINPRDPMSHTNVGTYLQRHGQIEMAIAEYQKAISLTSDAGLLSQVYANLGAAQRTLGQDVAAQTSFEQCLRLHPNQPAAWLGLGLIAGQQGRSEEAITDISRSIELLPSAQAYFELGNVLAHANRRGEALAAYQEALKISPGMAEAQQAADTLTRNP